MTNFDTQIRALQEQIAHLCELRNQRVTEAQAAIKRANKEFDRDLIPLHRRIKKLEIEQAKQDREMTKQTNRQFVRTGTHDPDWSQEDIDHFYELQTKAGAAS